MKVCYCKKTAISIDVLIRDLLGASGNDGEQEIKNENLGCIESAYLIIADY